MIVALAMACCASMAHRYEYGARSKEPAKVDSEFNPADRADPHSQRRGDPPVESEFSVVNPNYNE